MLRVPISLATPGMTLAAALRHPRRADHVLLQVGYALDEFALTRLQEMGVREVWIRYPGLDFIGKYISPAVLEGQARLVSTVADVFDATAKGLHARLDYPAYKDMIGEFLETLLESPQAGLFLQEMADRDEPLLRHCSNVCFVSLLMGVKLETYVVSQRRRLPANRAKNLVSLGMSALLHDIGMQRLDAQTLQRWEATQDESDPTFRTHAQIGYDLVKGSVEPSAAAAVLHHHQRWDGSGFPEQPGENGVMGGLKAEKIHIFARIIATADIFDRLRQPPAGGPGLPTVGALRAMQTQGIAEKVDPWTLRALLAVVPPYPPGSLVALSNGARGVVTEWRSEDPCRPVVRTLACLEKRAGRAPATERTIDLLTNKDVRVVEAEGRDVEEFNFYPSSAGQFGLTEADRRVA